MIKSIQMPRSWPSAIIHVDADAFFAACELAIDPSLRGKPIIVTGGGAQKGVVTSASYEARPFGLKAGMPVYQARKLCPKGTYIESHFEHYGMLSRKIFAAMENFSPMVEEASIDEGYADITGLRRLHKCPYEEIAKRMQAEILKISGINVSVGLAPTKILAKIASDFQKPNGFVVVSAKHVTEFLKEVPVKDVPGIGFNSEALVSKYGVRTAWDYVNLGEARLKKLFGKRGVEMYHELSGESVYAVTNEVAPHKSISRNRTLDAPTADSVILQTSLITNLTHLSTRLRRYDMSTRMMGVWLRDQRFITTGSKIRLPRYMRIDEELIPYAKSLFRQCYRPGTLYRLTGLVLSELTVFDSIQPSLFDNPEQLAKQYRAADASDLVNGKFGRGTIVRATTKLSEDPMIVCSFQKGSDIQNVEL